MECTVYLFLQLCKRAKSNCLIKPTSQVFKKLKTWKISHEPMVRFHFCFLALLSVLLLSSVGWFSVKQKDISKPALVILQIEMKGVGISKIKLFSNLSWKVSILLMSFPFLLLLNLIANLSFKYYSQPKFHFQIIVVVVVLLLFSQKKKISAGKIPC